MGTTIQLEATDGHTLSAYRADPEGPKKGCVLVIQEIFGVNTHIRSVCDDYAADGYVALAPALFDRVKPGVEVGYDQAGMQEGIACVRQLTPGNTLRDLQAGASLLAKEGKVGVVGYCYGGSMAWVAAAKLDDVACASGYYGSLIPAQADLTPRVPVILHFGDQDRSIPLEGVEKFRAAHPEVPCHIYPAGHGFNCDARESYHAESARLAKERTLALFAEHLR